MPFSNYFSLKNSCLLLSKCCGHIKSLLVDMANSSEDEGSDCNFDDSDFEPNFSDESGSDSNEDSVIELFADNGDIYHIEVVENIAENIEQSSVSSWSDYEGRQKCFDFTGTSNSFVRSYLVFTICFLLLKF